MNIKKNIFKIIYLLGLTLLLSAGFTTFSLSDIPSAPIQKKNITSNLLIINANVISMVSDDPELIMKQSVFVQDGIIQHIGSVKEIDSHKGAQIIDASEKYLMPGLIDAHVHLNDEAELAGYLANGVTGIRNMSGYPFHIILRDKINNSKLLAPDFMTTGPIINSPGENQNIIQQLVISEEDGRQAVQNQFDAGFRLIKVYSNLTLEAFKGISEQAKVLGMKVSGHSPEGLRTKGIPQQKPFDITWKDSLGKGFISFEHIETIVWHALKNNLDDVKITEVTNKLRDSGESVVPTLLAHKRLVFITESKGDYLNRAGADTINPLVTFFELGAIEFWSNTDPSAYERPHADFFSKATRILHQTNVPIIAGTDSGSFAIIPGKSLITELELLVTAGLSNFEALNSATSVSARVLGFDKIGYRANLWLLSKNPLTSIKNLDTLTEIIIRGQLINGDKIN
ncbi:MAG: hypothetical protein ACJAWQ_001777, partial [Paraglaciecola sp.]